MKSNERINKFLELQNKNVDIENIAKELGITIKTLRSFLNKNGYKLNDGKYVLNEEAIKDNQISFEQIGDKTSTKKRTNKTNKTKEVVKTKEAVKTKGKKESIKVEKNNNKETKIKVKADNKVKSARVKNDKKINVTQDDLDKLCEVYDWYLQVKDYKAMKPKAKTSKKDIIIEEIEMKELKTTSIRVEKNTWEDFERLCSNSKFSKQEIFTQALKDFMKQYKNLL